MLQGHEKLCQKVMSILVLHFVSDNIWKEVFYKAVSEMKVMDLTLEAFFYWFLIFLFIHSTCSFEHQEVWWLSKNTLKSKGHSFTKVPVKAPNGFTFKVNENAVFSSVKGK